MTTFSCQLPSKSSICVIHTCFVHAPRHLQVHVYSFFLFKHINHCLPQKHLGLSRSAHNNTIIRLTRQTDRHKPNNTQSLHTCLQLDCSVVLRLRITEQIVCKLEAVNNKWKAIRCNSGVPGFSIASLNLI